MDSNLVAVAAVHRRVLRMGIPSYRTRARRNTMTPVFRERWFGGSLGYKAMARGSQLSVCDRPAVLRVAEAPLVLHRGKVPPSRFPASSPGGGLGGQRGG